MRLSFSSRFFFILLAFLAVMSFGITAPVSSYAAAPSSKDFVETRKSKKKKTTKKKKAVTKQSAKKAAKKAPVLRAKNSVPYKEPVHKEDPMASEPSEMITAIKNRAQRAYWEGRKPLHDQRANPQAGAAALSAVEASNTLKRVSYSDVIGVTFDDQPLRMGASDTFRRSLETVSFELGTPCRKPEEMYHEYFGWPLQQTEQARVDRIFEDTQAKLKLRGFSVMPHRPRAVGSDVSVFTGERLKKHFIGLWSAGDAGLLLLVCETEKHSAPVAAAAPEKTKKKVLKPRKKKVAAPPKKKKKIEVIPGAAAQEAAPSSSLNEPSSAPAAGSPPAAFNPSDAPKTDVAPAAPPATAPADVKPAEPAVAPPAAAVPDKPVEAAPAPPVATPPAPAPEPPKTETAPSVSDVVKDAAQDAAKEAVKDAVKDVVPQMPAAIPGVPAIPAAPSIPAIP